MRETTLDDVPALVQLAQGYFEENAQWSGLTFSPENAAKTAVFRIMSDDSFILVYEVSGKIVGFVSVGLDSTLTVEPVAYEEMFYVHKDYRKTRAAIVLARAYVNKALELGAKKVYTSSTAGFGAAPYIKLMERMGFNVIENGVFLEYEQV